MSFILMKNMEKIVALLFMVVVHQSWALYQLTDEQIASFPPLNHVDRFSHCVDKPSGLFCTAHASLVSERPNQILDLMHHYRSLSHRNVNYTNVKYGFCMTETCKSHLNGSSDLELMKAAEACLNETLTRSHDLQARVTKINCYSNDKPMETTTMDWLVLYGLLGLVLLNIAATLYDVVYDKKDEEGYLLSFSLRGNWSRLSAPAPTDPKKSRLVGFNGIRIITTITVIMSHAPIPMFSSTENTGWLQWAFLHQYLNILFQGHPVTMTFFIMSGFFLTYNLKQYSETHKLTWSLLPKVILVRWLRLLPVNICMLLITVTWFRFIPKSPFWQENIGNEVADCTQYWLSQVFYYNNYLDNSTCGIQNWSLAADMHLHILGLAVVILSSSSKARNRMMLALYLLGVAILPLETYLRDLDASFLVVPDVVQDYFMTDPTFNYNYRRTHSNIPGFIMGMALGYYVYDVQSIKAIPRKIRMVLTGFYWTLFPVMCLIAMSTFWTFLGDGPRASLAFRVAYAAVQRPYFGVVLCLIFLGMIYKIESFRLYSGILELPLWTPLARLSYSVFSTHVLLMRYAGGSRSTLSYLSFFSIMIEFGGLVVMAFVAGTFLHLLVEAPFGQLVKVSFSPSGNKKSARVNGNSAVANGNSAHSNGNLKQSNGKSNGVHSNGKPLKAE